MEELVGEDGCFEDGPHYDLSVAVQVRQPLVGSGSKAAGRVDNRASDVGKTVATEASAAEESGCQGKNGAECSKNVAKPDEKGKLRKFFNSAKRQGMEVVPEPKGRPIFLFFAAKGRNKPVQVFFDNGCSDCVVREGMS